MYSIDFDMHNAKGNEFVHSLLVPSFVAQRVSSKGSTLQRKVQ